MDKQAFLQNAILAGQETQKEKHIVESKNIKNSGKLLIEFWMAYSKTSVKQSRHFGMKQLIQNCLYKRLLNWCKP